jgi:hypothetical protein
MEGGGGGVCTNTSPCWINSELAPNSRASFPPWFLGAWWLLGADSMDLAWEVAFPSTGLPLGLDSELEGRSFPIR